MSDFSCIDDTMIIKKRNGKKSYDCRVRLINKGEPRSVAINYRTAILIDLDIEMASRMIQK